MPVVLNWMLWEEIAGEARGTVSTDAEYLARIRASDCVQSKLRCADTLLDMIKTSEAFRCPFRRVPRHCLYHCDKHLYP